MSPFDHPSGRSASRRRSGPPVGRLLVLATLVLAATAAAVLVLASEARWLRLGVVAALWAALVAAFAAARYRRDVVGQNDLAEELQRTYELELEREIAARREYELQVENSTRRMVEQEVRTEVRGELDGLRSELRGLRQNLEALLGGEVLVERVALRAESTRLRSLSDQSRAARTGERALPRGRSDTASNTERMSNTKRSTGRTANPERTPASGHAYTVDTDVESTRVDRAASGQWPAAGRGHDTSGTERTDVLPRYRAEPAAASRPARAEPSRRDTPSARATPRAQPPRTEPPQAEWPRTERPRSEPVRRVASERADARHTGEPRRAERVTPAAQRKEPARPEPAWPQPARAESARPESTWTQSAAAEPARAASTRAEPTRAEPTRAEPTRAEPTRADSRRQEPARSEPQWPEPARAEPQWPEPQWPEPARVEPRQPESEVARSEPARSEPSQPVGWPAPAPVRAEPGSRDMWRSDTGHLRAIDRDQPTPAGGDRRRQRPAAHGQHHEYRTGPHRVQPEPPVRQDHGGPPSDPLGIDPMLIGERPAGDYGPPTAAWESFDSWVSASGSRGSGSPVPVRLDDTGSYVLPGVAGPVSAGPVPEPAGRRHRSDESARSVDDLMATYREEPEPRHRNRHEA